MPPNGRSCWKTCQPQSLRVTPPAWVCSSTRCCSVTVQAEAVERQRTLALFHQRQGVVEAVVLDHRQDGPEDLFAHHAHAVVDTGHDVQRHLPAGTGIGAATHHLRALRRGVVEQVAQPRRVALGDDAGVLGVAADRRIQPVEGIDHRGGERDGLAARHQRIVGCDADLSGVEDLAVGDAQRRVAQIGFGPDDRRRLAAEFERHRRQVVGGSAHHLAANLRRAGEDDVVERQRGERLCGLDRATADRHFILVEALRPAGCAASQSCAASIPTS